MREYLDALEKSNLAGDGDAEPPEPPAPGKNVSLTDPAARWTAAPGGPAFYAYSTNYLIDLDAGIIVDVEATPAHRTREVESTNTMANRRIMRSVHGHSRDVAREIADTPQYKQSRRDRKKVEMLFAHLKGILKPDRLRLRGLTGAHDEFLLIATAQNLRRMAKRLFEGQQSPVAMPA
jgi:hypothetical protein